MAQRSLGDGRVMMDSRRVVALFVAVVASMADLARALFRSTSRRWVCGGWWWLIPMHVHKAMSSELAMLPAMVMAGEQGLVLCSIVV